MLTCTHNAYPLLSTVILEPMTPLEPEALTGTRSRTYKTRNVTDEQVNRPFHVAIAVWEERWKSSPTGWRTEWVIAFNPRGNKPFLHMGTTDEKDPNPLILRDLLQQLRKQGRSKSDVWVVVGRRRLPLASLLTKEGFDLTGSFSEKNRASDKASEMRRKGAKGLHRKAKREDEAPKQVTTKEIETTETLWLPNSSKSAGQGGKIRISCDASSDTQTKGSMCFVASNGDFQLRTKSTKASTDELELETITLALKYLVRIGATSAIVETDSMAALEATEYIRRGGRARRMWRGISLGARDRFSNAWKAAEGKVDVDLQRVFGHAGDPLNKAADQIAYMALRATAHPKQQAQPTLDKAINKAVTDASKAAKFQAKN